MKIDNLISNLQKNTAEQDRIIKEQAENATKQHLVVSVVPDCWW